LGNAIMQKVPEVLKKEIPGIKNVFGSIKEDIRRIRNRNKIENIWFYIDNNISNWNLESENFITDFKYGKENIKLVVIDKLEYSDNKQNIITAIKTGGWAEFYADKNKYDRLKPICQIQLKDNSFITYYAEKFENAIDKNWGNTLKVFRVENSNNLELEKISIELPTDKIYEVKLELDHEIKSTNFARIFLDEVKKEFDIESLMANQKYDIVYSDRYLRSPFACMLLIQFLSEFRRILNLDINSLLVKVSDFTEYKGGKLLFHNYQNSDIRNKKLIELAKEYQLPIDLSSKNLPHYRFFQFKNDKKTIIIRPDGGIEHGWHLATKVYDNNINELEPIYIRKAVDYPILYTVIIEKLVYG